MQNKFTKNIYAISGKCKNITLFATFVSVNYIPADLLNIETPNNEEDLYAKNIR